MKLQQVVMFILVVDIIETGAKLTERCLDCISKGFYWGSKVDSCVYHRRSEVCGLYSIAEGYFSECRADLPAEFSSYDFYTCAKNVQCARECVRRNLERSAPECQQMANLTELTCKDYLIMHATGPRHCKEYSMCPRPETGLLKRMLNASEHCPDEVVITECTSNEMTIAIAVSVPLVILLIAVVALLVVKFYRHKRGKQDNGDVEVNQKKELQYCLTDDLKELLQVKYIARHCIEIIQPIGTGHFGKVYKAKIKDNNLNDQVAVKMLKCEDPTYDEIKGFFDEAVIMADFDHQNVVNLIGLCWETGSPPMIVLPYMGKGDLRNLLRKDELVFTVGDLVTFAIQIVHGMIYLQSKNVIHRDLSAKNCLVTDYFIIKIGDFGLMRENYYTTDDCSVLKPLPWKWMALECIKEGKFSSSSDVWSFGILMWELFTSGSSPYPATENASSLLQSLTIGERLSQPGMCPDTIFCLMKNCWLECPSDRPTFKQLRDDLEKILQECQDNTSYLYTIDFGSHSSSSPLSCSQTGEDKEHNTDLHTDNPNESIYADRIIYQIDD